MNQTKETQPTWGYASRAFKDTPVLGSFHSSDVLSLYGARPGAPGDEMRQRWLEFTYNLNREFSSYCLDVVRSRLLLPPCADDYAFPPF